MHIPNRFLLSASLLLGACASPPDFPPGSSHLGPLLPDRPMTAQAPASPRLPPAPPSQAPGSAVPLETYSVVVTGVRLQDLLFALARDAHLNVDIHPGITGSVTLNAISQTLPQILARIARQADVRFEFDGTTLRVMPDTPFLRLYRLDYVNLSRQMSGTVATNTQIATSGAGSVAAGQSASANPIGGGNISATRIENTSRNQFWDSVEKNLKDLLRETDKILPEGSRETLIENSGSSVTTGSAMPAVPAQPPRARGRSTTPRSTAPGGPSAAQSTTTTLVQQSTFREAAAVIANRETGVLTVRATGRQHEKVEEFLEQVTQAARRQVLIEATIVEVALGDTYRQGIDWSRVLAGGTRFGLTGPGLGSTAGSGATPFSLAYQSRDGIDSTVKLLESFGTVKVLSSPKLSVLNNQTAAIKVVEEYVYFTVKADTSQTTNAGVLTTVTTTPQAVSVGLVMTVTPQISETDEIILNIRPTISSISDFRRDPNPNIPATIPNLVPQIRTREIESILRIENGETAILGGLMEDRIDYRTGRVPLIGSLPLFGEVFTSRDNGVQKTELVIFLRPVVVREARLLARTPQLREHLPGEDFFRNTPSPGQRNFPGTPLPLEARP